MKNNEPVDERGPVFAFGLDGRIYMSVFELDGIVTLEDAARAARDEKYIFVGVALSGVERRRLARHLRDAGREAGGYIAGGRRWKK